MPTKKTITEDMEDDAMQEPTASVASAIGAKESVATAIDNITPVNDDRGEGYHVSDAAITFADEINFRNDVGYDDNWPMRVRSALDRILNRQFGTLDASGHRTYDALPAFDPGNKVIVTVTVVRE